MTTTKPSRHGATPPQLAIEIAPPKPKARSFTDWTRDHEELIAEIETIESQSASARDPKRIADTLTLVGALGQEHKMMECRTTKELKDSGRQIGRLKSRLQAVMPTPEPEAESTTRKKGNSKKAATKKAPRKKGNGKKAATKKAPLCAVVFNLSR